MFNLDIMYCFSQSHIKHFNNPFIKQIYSLKFFQRPGFILGQIGIQPNIGDHRVRPFNSFNSFQFLLFQGP